MMNSAKLIQLAYNQYILEGRHLICLRELIDDGYKNKLQQETNPFLLHHKVYESFSVLALACIGPAIYRLQCDRRSEVSWLILTVFVIVSPYHTYAASFHSFR